MRTQQWVSALPDHVKINYFSWPGTHDSGATHYDAIGAKCQDWSIMEQLEKGIRFLDIRLKHNHSVLNVYHGITNQHLSFQAVINDCIDFLNKNPRETILMSVNDEGEGILNFSTFHQCVKGYIESSPEYWYTGSRIPKLGEVRKKIVLFRRYGFADAEKVFSFEDDITEYGISWKKSCVVQDEYNLTKLDQHMFIRSSYSLDENKKWDKMTELFDKSEAYFDNLNREIEYGHSWMIENDTIENSTIFVNFASGYWNNINTTSVLPLVKDVSNFTGPKVKNFMRERVQNGRTNFACIIPMDFPEEKTIDAIIFQTYHRHGLLKRCRIYSLYRNEYLYASGADSEVSNERRGVFTYVGGSHDDDMIWWLIGSAERGLFWIFHQKQHEYAFGSEATYDANRNYVYTWEPGTDRGKAGWYIDSNRACTIDDPVSLQNCRIKNYELKRYIYPAAFTKTGSRRYVFQWKPDEFTVEGKWRFEFLD